MTGVKVGKTYKPDTDLKPNVLEWKHSSDFPSVEEYIDKDGNMRPLGVSFVLRQR